MPGLVVGMISLLTTSSYFSSKEVFTHHTQDIMRNISSYTIDKSRSHLNPARDAVLLTSGLAVNEIVTSSKKEDMENYFYEQLMVNTQISNIFYGTVEGEFVMVSRRGGRDQYLTKIITYPEGQRDVSFIERNHRFEETSRYTAPQDTYDPRKRPWFVEALAEGGLIWTTPYVFFTSRNPGITSASPVYTPEGLLHGVVGVDIEISNLSDFIKTLSIGENGKAFILDSQGQVLAYPDKSMITHSTGESDSVSLINISELADPISQAAYNKLQTLEYDLHDHKELFFTFKYDDEIYHAMFAPFKASYWPWLLGIYVAEDDYIGVLKRNRTYSILLSLGVGVVTILIGFLITSSIVSPLLKLQLAAKRVGAGHLGDSLDVKTHYREVDDTAEIFEMMRMDLIEKAKIEEQVKQDQKVESIGRLAGGVAHDLNNLLSPVLGYSELLVSQFEDEKSKQQVRQIYKAGSKAKKLVQQLLAFSKKQKLEYKPVNLNELFGEFKNLLRRTIREDITIILNESNTPPIVMADPVQIEQVLMNLSINAQDAMEDGGDLTIELSLVDLDNTPETKYHNIAPGKWVQLAVSDVGCGMEKEIQNQIFDPFFTTKGELGTGLGLSTVHGIVNQHQGDIIVYSEAGEGTTFKVYLPYCEEPVTQNRANPLVKPDLNGSGTILVAEDNELVLELTVTILEELGYDVLPAENGMAALEILNNHEDPIHLLLSDVIMPELNGPDLYDRALLIHQDLKVLFMSGYADNAIEHHQLAGRNADFIQKPFSMGVLAKKIRHILMK